MKDTYGKLRNRLLAGIAAFAFLPLAVVLAIKVAEVFAPVFAVVGFVVMARFGWRLYRDRLW